MLDRCEVIRIERAVDDSGLKTSLIARKQQGLAVPEAAQKLAVIRRKEQHDFAGGRSAARDNLLAAVDERPLSL